MSQSQSNIENTSIDNEKEEIYLSLCIQNKTTGGSFYDAKQNIIYVIPDFESNDKYDTLIDLIIEIRPLLFISTKQVFDKIKSIFSDGQDDSMILSEDVFSFVTLNDLSYDLSLRKLNGLSLPCSKSMTEQDKFLLIRSLIPTDSYNMIRSCGGLLKFIEKRRVGIELESDLSYIPCLDIRIFTLSNTMFIDDDSLRALNIFNKISHPSGFKQGLKGDIKEGPSIYSKFCETLRNLKHFLLLIPNKVILVCFTILSVFKYLDLLNNCHSKMASDLLRNWIRRPLVDVSIIQKRLDCVEFFQSSQNYDLLQSIQRKLKCIGNIKQILSRMKNSSAMLTDWNILLQSITGLINIYDIFSNVTQPIEIKNKITCTFSDELCLIASYINKFIDIDGIEKQHRFVVKEGVDLSLDEKKSKYYYLPDLLTKLAEEELKSFNENIHICGIVYLPQLGYLLTLPVNCDVISLPISTSDMEYLFSMNNAAYYKNNTTRKLDKEFGDILNEIRDTETSIMHHLQERILQYAHMLLNCMDIIVELDCLVSLAVSARKIGGTRPQFKSNGGIEIENGRHPLQEMYSNPFVANSTYSNERVGKVTLISGANGSGKSVYIKQIGILIIMAQIGSFVPADKMVLSPQKAILTRLKSMESSLSGLSTFMVDLNQISLCCKKSSISSTILIDEFGKGVEIRSGISLLAAFLRYMLNKKSDCPHIFLVTHFHRLFSLIQNYPKVQFKNFNVIEDKNGQLIYLYQLIDGVIDNSHAFQAAKLVNIPDEILQRAQEVAQSSYNNDIIKPIHSICYDHDPVESTEILRKFVSLDFQSGNIKEKLCSLFEK